MGRLSWTIDDLIQSYRRIGFPDVVVSDEQPEFCEIWIRPVTTKTVDVYRCYTGKAILLGEAEIIPKDPADD